MLQHPAYHREVLMLYLVDPECSAKPRCNPVFTCTTYCGIKPCYGIDPYI